jgi:TatD DNase family protein
MCYKNSMFVDSHCHLELEDYDEDREQTIRRASDAGVSYVLTVATEAKYFPRLVEIIDSHPRVYGAVGLHPHNAVDYSPAFETTVKELSSHPKIVGYGEIGLDFYRNHSPRDVQIRVFIRQIEVARERGLPIIIHSRDARDETLHIIRETGLPGYPFVVHCYSYDVDTALKLVDMGAHLSIPGTVTYKKSGVADVVRQLPLESLLSETDAPFLAPSPLRGKRNEPAFVRLVVEQIAVLKGKEPGEVGTILANNFVRLFLGGVSKEVG